MQFISWISVLGSCTDSQLSDQILLESELSYCLQS